MDTNIIAVNVPNAVSIVLMAVVGLLLLSGAHKLIKSRQTAAGGM